MSLITTHVLDTAAGESASGVAVRLGYCEVPEWPWAILNQDKTDANGRLKNLLAPGHVLQPGLYRLRFDTSVRSPFFLKVVVQFVVSDVRQHYRIFLLLTHFGYTTYRGS